MGIDTSSIPLYLNFLFFGLLGLGMFFGFLRGLRKSIYSFVVKLVFYLIFFATLGVASRFLWNAEFAFIGNLLSMVTTGMGGVRSLSEALPILIENNLGGTLNADLTNPDFVAFAEGLGMFIVKIVYAVLYFTVIQLIYRLITWILYLVFFKPKKEDLEVHGKHRLPGMAVGLLSGALAVYATLVLLGGVMNISENLVTLAEGLDTEETASRRDDSSPAESDPVLRLASRPQAVPMQTDPTLDPALEDLSAIVDAYNTNVIVSSFTSVNLTDGETGRETPLNLHLFDMIFSFEYKEEDIAFRNELAVFTDVAGVFLGSQFSETNDLSDLEGSEIRTMFTELSNSKLLTSLMPVALEMGAEHYDVNLDLERDDLYAIDYSNELTQIGEVFATAFDMLNNAGALGADADLDTVSLDGDDAEDIFQGLGDSELATLGAYVAMEPLLERYFGETGAVLTVPEGIVWEDEFDAFGEVSKAILNTGITLGEIQSGDIMLYLQKLSSMDLTVILNSRIIEQALVNVLSGAAEIEGMDMMVVNDDVQWLDEVVDGDIVEEGELRIVLEALNTFAENEDVDAIEAFDQNVLLNISEDTLDAFLESTVLTDTIGDFIVNLETDALVIPPSVLRTITVDGDDRDVVSGDEIRNMFLAVQTIDIEDFETVDFSADLLSTLEDADAPGTLDTDKADTLFDSGILHATVSKVLVDLTEDANQTLVVPDTDIDGLSIRSTDPDDSTIDYISTDELKALLETVIVLDLADFENFETLDATTIATEIDTVLDSAILHATFSDQIVQLDTDGTITVPYYNEDDTVEIRKTVSGTEFVTQAELENLVAALEIISGTDSLTDFSGDITLSTIYDEDAGVDERATILASSTLQATISKQLIDLEGDDFIEVPHVAFDPDTDDEYDVRLTSTAGAEDTEYILSDEISQIIESLYILGADDVTTYEGDVTLNMFYDSDAGVDRRDDILASAVMHATITNQMTDLGSDQLVVPENGIDSSNNPVPVILETTTADDPADDRSYVSRDEIKALIASMDVLDITNIDTFDGTVDLDAVFGSSANQDILLSSASIHATIVEQLETLGSETLLIPDEDASDVTVRTAVSFVGDTATFDYITKDEIKALINAMEKLGLQDNDLNNFDGSFDLNNVSAEADQDILLDSASMHATFSREITELSDDILIVPDTEQNGSTAIKTLNSNSREFVVEGEIKALINAFLAMGYGDLDSFGTEIESSKFFTSRDTLLLSSSIQATVSEKLLNDTNDVLVVPDENTAGDPIRLLSDTYIDIDELEALLDGLDELGLTNFGTMDFVPDDIFNSDYATMIQASASIQMSISDTILENAYRTQGATTVPTDLVVPDALRNALPVATISTEQIEQDELIDLIAALDTVGITDFDGTVDAATVTGMTETELNTILASGSIHVTVDNMIDDNAALAVPDYADTNTGYDAVDDDPLYGLSDITYKAEIIDLIAAVNVVAGTGDDITNISFDLATIQSLTPGEQATIGASMTARNTLTPDIETAYSTVVGGSVPNTYYHDDDTNIYLDEQGFIDALDDIEAATP